MNKDNGLLVVLSSPSGGGKTTVIKRILKEGNDDYLYSVSMTTRSMRDGEVDGKDYWFVSSSEFQAKIEDNEFIEYEKVHDWYYGTPKGPIQKWIEEGNVVFLDLDVYGALELKKQFDQKILLIFLRPPNEGALMERLKKRSTETSLQIDKRLERAPQEMNRADEFDVTIVNDDLNETVRQVKKIISDKRTYSSRNLEV